MLQCLLVAADSVDAIEVAVVPVVQDVDPAWLSDGDTCGRRCCEVGCVAQERDPEQKLAGVLGRPPGELEPSAMQVAACDDAPAVARLPLDRDIRAPGRVASDAAHDHGLA